jgi:hypothetical protein
MSLKQKAEKKGRRKKKRKKRTTRARRKANSRDDPFHVFMSACSQFRRETGKN